MMLDLKDLEAHADAILAEIKEIEAFRERYAQLKLELKATKLLIEREHRRRPNKTSKPDAGDARDKPRSVRGAVERYFNNGVEGWVSVSEITRVLEDMAVNATNLYSSIGMACVKLFRKGVLARKDSSKTKTPVYLYRLK